MFFEPKYAIGDQVAFDRMCQPGYPPFSVQDVDPTLFGVRYKVNNKWWSEGNLMPFEDWKKLSK
jgi:hypothetical protein